MSTIGKVFTVLNVLIALAFLYFSTPVIKKYIDLQKDVKAIEFGGQDSTGATHRSQAEIEESTVQLDVDRVSRQLQLATIQDSVSLVRHARTQRVDELTKQNSFYQNLQESEAFLVKKWEETQGLLQAQVEQRKEELQGLQTKLSELQQVRGERQQAVDGLSSRLAEAEKQLSETLAALQNNYEKLEKLVAGFAAEVSNKVADSAKEARE